MKNGNRVYFNGKYIDKMIDKIDNAIDKHYELKSKARLARLQAMKSSTNGIVRIKREI